MSVSISRGFRLALCQFGVGKSKTQNIATALGNIRTAVIEKGAKVVALPECFNSPYGTKYFNEYAEEVPTGETCKSLAAIAKELGIYLIGGTIPERDPNDNKLYNTCTVWGPSGELLTKYRKIHLFDIDIPGGITFRESDVLAPGSKFSVIEIEKCKIGIGICYDIRFTELSQLYRLQGCDVLLFPAAFNMKTGPLHWELLGRARATDNQLFVGLISPARDTQADYVAWGHSMVIDPWGQVMQSADAAEAILVQDIDCTAVDQVRAQIPVSRQTRSDLYETRAVDSKLFESL